MYVYVYVCIYVELNLIWFWFVNNYLYYFYFVLFFAYCAYLPIQIGVQSFVFYLVLFREYFFCLLFPTKRRKPNWETWTQTEIGQPTPINCIWRVWKARPPPEIIEMQEGGNSVRGRFLCTAAGGRWPLQMRSVGCVSKRKKFSFKFFFCFFSFVVVVVFFTKSMQNKGQTKCSIKNNLTNHVIISINY